MSIRQERTKAGLTQTSLARVSGVSREQINKYENGKRMPDLATLIRIRDALGCSLDELVKEENRDA